MGRIKMRALHLPPCVIEANDLKSLIKKSFFVARSDLQGRIELQWELREKKFEEDTWCDFQYDLESGGGGNPRDMFYGFVALPFCPNVGNESIEAAFERLCIKTHKGLGIPPLHALKKLKWGDALDEGSWIIIVKCPRPIGSRYIVPFNRRKDVFNLIIEYEIHHKESAIHELNEIRTCIKNEIHPTDAKLVVLPNGSLMQSVPSTLHCFQCGAVGHHSAQTHDEVMAKPIPKDYKVQVQNFFPTWMNVLPIDKEVLKVPVVEQDKGFEVTIRQSKTQIPLRLARAMKLTGTRVDGEVYMTGITPLPSAEEK